ncbi:phytoene/squalene synthase family protein [Williamsia serinedens]|uniref:Phytoene synthase n=1 Tax=Williamsia serinedens TaxID=391736 RepID=A0ABT1H5N0_9NOCA|nr:phytoene/squalene synthase family protein [Williamsia serinedens]MCP2162545.1 phytoene synthase [Williamsia serinedens]
MTRSSTLEVPDGPSPDDLHPADRARVERGYAIAERVTAEHGRTYHLGTRLLPAPRRRAVYALYGFARLVDDVVDVDPDSAVTDGVLDASESVWSVDGAEALDPTAVVNALDDSLRRALEARRTPGARLPEDADDRILALADTIVAFDIPEDHFRAFMTSMRMDLPGDPLFTTRYATFDELDVYMYGSASVIGLQMVPILGSSDPDAALPLAAALGEAFQLTNFIRDVGEDLDRGRIYLPTEELAAFGVDEDMLAHARRTGISPRPLQRGLAHCIAVTRARYRVAEPGIALLDRRSRPAIRAAFELYRDILEQVEAADHHVLGRRVVVGGPRRARRAAAAVVRGG